MAHHVVPQKIYLLVFATLILLTLVTVDVAFYDLGLLNLYIALAIAVTKATIVILYFMHVKYSSRLVWVFVGSGFFWLAVLLVLTLSDFFTRGWSPLPSGWTSMVMP
ncbi:MAG: caa(3)-type oxidase subunit IV [Acidobacteria bacterium]|nr:MAG: caa(3)-type oxidase subunit IV [Acidobacteriota bacterium]